MSFQFLASTNSSRCPTLSVATTAPACSARAARIMFSVQSLRVRSGLAEIPRLCPEFCGPAHRCCGYRLVIKQRFKLVKPLDRAGKTGPNQFSPQFVIGDFGNNDAGPACEELFDPLLEIGIRHWMGEHSQRPRIQHDR